MSGYWWRVDAGYGMYSTKCVKKKTWLILKKVLTFIPKLSGGVLGVCFVRRPSIRPHAVWIRCNS